MPVSIMNEIKIKYIIDYNSKQITNESENVVRIILVWADTNEYH